MNLKFKNYAYREEFCWDSHNVCLVEHCYDELTGFECVENDSGGFNSAECGQLLVASHERYLFDVVDPANVLLTEALEHLPTDTSDSQDLRNKICNHLEL